MELKSRLQSHISTFARVGYSARAAVYFMMGGLALLLALGSAEGATTDSKGTLRELLEHRYGTIFLVVLAVGLFCYAIWRIYEAIKNPANEGKGKRAGYVLGGIAHASLGLYALNLIFYFSKPSSNSEKNFAHELLNLPFGRFLTGAVGIGVICFGLYQFVVAIKEKFTRNLAIPSDKKQIVMPLCKFGLIARGGVFALIGWFFVQAALKFSSQEAGGIARAWGVLRNQPYGNVLLIVVALGFMAFGVYGATEAMYESTPDRA